ncbi:MAG: cyclophilin-like fold protein [Eubacterium sp.]|nr:cyclophilin-like fold protein [Eubacterium sp.]
MSDSRMIRMAFDGGEILVQLEENAAAEDLLSRLPLTLSFEDFNGTEKISYLDSALNIGDAPRRCTPQAGDLTYYIPWGNLAFFYSDFRESPQLVPLGRVTQGMEYLEQLDGAGEITVESYAE